MAATLRETEEERNRFRHDAEDAKAALRSLQVEILIKMEMILWGSLHPCIPSVVSASDDELRGCRVCLAERKNRYHADGECRSGWTLRWRSVMPWQSRRRR